MSWDPCGSPRLHEGRWLRGRVVKDYRLPPKRPCILFPPDLAAVAQEAGWLWHDLVMWDQNEQRSLVLLGFPTRFYTNQNCSFLVVLRKDG